LSPEYYIVSGDKSTLTLRPVFGEYYKPYIIAYENPEYFSDYENEIIIVLYLAGYAKRLEKEDFLFELKKTYEHIGKPMPEIKFKE